MNFWIIKVGALGLYVGPNIINSSLFKHFAFIKMTAIISLSIISGHLCNHHKNNEFSLRFLNEWLIVNRCPRVILTWKVSKGITILGTGFCPNITCHMNFILPHWLTIWTMKFQKSKSVIWSRFWRLYPRFSKTRLNPVGLKPIIPSAFSDPGRSCLYNNFNTNWPKSTAKLADSLKLTVVPRKI